MASETNPAKTEATLEERKRARIPMSVPQRRLEVPEIPGYHQHFFLERNIDRALQAGYEFVHRKDATLNQKGVASSKDTSGNAALDSQVKVVGGTNEGGHTEYLYLMKIPQEWWDEDQKKLEVRNAEILGSIFKGERIIGEERQSAEDRGTAYVDKERTSLFQRPKRKA